MLATKSRTPRRKKETDTRLVFGERLAELRRAQDLTVEKFAELFSAKPNTVRDWLNARVLPRAEALLSIARYFGVSVDWLLGIDGAPKHPTKWRSMTEFEQDLQNAVIDRVLQRGQIAAELLSECEIDGREALELLADQAESAILTLAKHRAGWITQRDALVAVNSEYHDLARLVAAMRTASLAPSEGRAAEGAQSYRRGEAQRAIQAIPEHGARILRAVTLAQAALQKALSENRAPVAVESGSQRELVTIATSKALRAEINRDRFDVNPELIEADLETSRRVAGRYGRAGRRPSTVTNHKTEP